MRTPRTILTVLAATFALSVPSAALARHHHHHHHHHPAQGQSQQQG